MGTSSDLTCVHQALGLCPQCQADYDEDPQAYIEYGNHPQGLVNWLETRERILQDASMPGLLHPAPGVKLRLAVMDLGDGQHEVWLVSNKDEVLAAFASDGGLNLDAAAAVAKDCLVVSSSWGDDVPDLRDDAWLGAVLAACEDPEDARKIKQVVNSFWDEIPF